MKVATAFRALILVLAAGPTHPPESPAQDKPTATPQAPGPKVGEILPAEVEKALRWGEPANGLRSALVIRPVPKDAKPGDPPDLYLAVQNVSTAPIRLDDSIKAPKLRELMLKQAGRIQLVMTFDEPTLGAVTLRPREVAYLPLFPPDSLSRDGEKVGAIVAEGAFKDPSQTLQVTLKIDQAPAGAWTGHLVARESSAAEASVSLRSVVRKK